MANTLAELARIVDGQVLHDCTRTIAGANTLSAAGADDITLLDSAEKAFLLARAKPARWSCQPVL